MPSCRGPLEVSDVCEDFGEAIQRLTTAGVPTVDRLHRQHALAQALLVEPLPEFLPICEPEERLPYSWIKCLAGASAHELDRRVPAREAFSDFDGGAQVDNARDERDGVAGEPERVAFAVPAFGTGSERQRRLIAEPEAIRDALRDLALLAPHITFETRAVHERADRAPRSRR